MSNTRKNDSSEKASDGKNNSVNENSRDLIKALKEGIKKYVTPRTSLANSFGRLNVRAVAAEQNIVRLEELEKQYGNAEIPKREIMACLIATGPAFAEMVFRCFEAFETKAEAAQSSSATRVKNVA
jgi:hypothetical protein